MADEKDPDLEQSHPTHGPTDTEEQHVDEPTASEQDTYVEVDPETRMLEEIATLRGVEPTGQDEQPTQVLDESAAPELEHTVYIAPLAATESDPATGTEETKPQRKRRWPWVTAGVAVLLLGGGYIGAAFALQDTLPATLTVEGVDVSGLSIEEATPVLEDALAERAQREITVRVEAQQAVLVPEESGYSYDVEATLQELTELSFDPTQLWTKFFGEAHVQAHKTVDESTAEGAIAGLAEQLTFDPTEGNIIFEDAAAHYTEPVDGFTVDNTALADLLAAEWLTETQELEAPGSVEDPAVSAEQWEQFLADTAEPLVADSYSVTADETTTQLTPAQLAAAAQVLVEEASEPEATEDQTTDDEATATVEEPIGDHPVLVLDGEALAASLSENNADFQSTNQDATVRLAGSAGSASPEVVPGTTGRGVNPEQVAEEILADLTGEQTRAVTVDLHEVAPDISTEDAEAWDVNHVVAEYATPYPPHDGPRTANLRVGAQRINGTVVKPGEEFNLNAILSPITAANGYHSSGVVESGVSTTALGGGLSQIATMSYNAGFLGGMEIVEHKPHSRWFDRYPQGRESTYWEGQINVRWKNDTDAPVIVEMWLANNQVHTRLWGSDYYDVSTTTSEPYNYTASPTIRNSNADCIPERGGRQGFTVDVHRTKTPPNGAAVQESWSWAYTGWPTVICE